MREPPPAQLASLLKRLGLATDQDLENVATIVHRMAGDLPRFESVWIDALRQARILTHFQAAEIHAGRGENLKVARYVLYQSVHECGYATIYRAEDQQTRKTVRLAIFSAQDHDQASLLAKLESLIAIGKDISPSAGPIEFSGLGGSQLWAASPWVEGTSLADWILHHGRLPPEMVMETARAMLGELVALEAVGLVHGDIRVQNVLVANDGEVHIPHPGLRGLIRPHEGLSYGDLLPDACSSLAPERVTEGRPPTVASDLFACGCVWWHVLCGRPPLGGGDTLARLRAAQAAAVDDLHQWVADVPDALVQAIGACLQKDPQQRPKSIVELAQRLGPLRRHSRQAIARGLAVAAAPRAGRLPSKPARGKRLAQRHPFTAVALALLAAVAVAWPLWVAHNRPQGSTSVASHTGSTAAKRQAGRAVGPAVKPPREVGPQAMLDKAVMPTGYLVAIGHSRATGENANGDSGAGRIGNPSHDPQEELRLPADRPIRGERLQFRAGLRVCAPGGRARIVVSRDGLTVHFPVSFENIDFVADKRTDQPATDKAPRPALIRLLAAECQFVGCSFDWADSDAELGAAVVWEYASAGRSAAVALPSGRIRIKDCVFRRVGVGIESHARGAMGLEIVNTLHLGPGPMIRLTHAPAADEPVCIKLSRVTVRGADALLDCRCSELNGPAGEISIEASGCVFAPRAQASLLSFTSDGSPRPLLDELKWTGQGSVVAGQVVFGRICRHDGSRQPIDDATISIAGLVRGEVEFAGKFDGECANSQVLNCQAPLQDADSAGADVRTLPPKIGP